MSKINKKSFTDLQEKVSEYYTERLRSYGATPQGADWNSKESQEIRFHQLLKVCEGKKYSLNEIGCGFGALLTILEQKGDQYDYLGCDLSSEMIVTAKKLFEKNRNSQFEVGAVPSRTADYTVASGIFNVRLKFDLEVWQKYVLDVLDTLDSSCDKGFAFNILTSYADKEHQKEKLFYADPCWFFDYCKHRFSKNVALLHDYNLYEFTIIVRKT